MDLIKPTVHDVYNADMPNKKMAMDNVMFVLKEADSSYTSGSSEFNPGFWCDYEYSFLLFVYVVCHVPLDCNIYQHASFHLSLLLSLAIC